MHGFWALRLIIGELECQPRTERDLFLNLYRLLQSYFHQRALPGACPALYRDAFSVADPLFGVGVVRHVQAGQHRREAQVRVQGEEGPAHERRGLEEGHYVGEEVRRVRVSRVRAWVCEQSGAGGGGRVVEDDGLVYGEDGEGAGDAAGDGHALVSGRKAERGTLV